MTKYFNINRFILTLRVQTVEHWRTYFFAGLSAGLLFLFYALANHLFGKSINENEVSFFFDVMLIIGVISTAGSFTGINSPQKGFLFFMFPASLPEKYLSRLLSTSLVYFIYSFLLILILSTAISLLNMAVLNFNFVTINPFDESFLNLAWGFIVYHSVFFCGSLIFKKNPFLLTITSIGVIAVSILLLVIIVMIIFGLKADPQLMTDIIQVINKKRGNLSDVGYYAWRVFKVILPITLYAVSYRLLSKKQLI